jgi:amino acid transporter
MGGEARNPKPVIPRSIMYRVIAVAVIYTLCNLSIIAVVPWREAVHSKFIASEFIERLYGTRAASAVRRPAKARSTRWIGGLTPVG